MGEKKYLEWRHVGIGDAFAHELLKCAFWRLDKGVRGGGEEGGTGVVGRGVGGVGDGWGGAEGGARGAG